MYFQSEHRAFHNTVYVCSVYWGIDKADLYTYELRYGGQRFILKYGELMFSPSFCLHELIEEAPKNKLIEEAVDWLINHGSMSWTANPLKKENNG